MTFESFELRRPGLTQDEAGRLCTAFETCLEFAEGNTAHKWLVLAGSKGWGKSHLSVAVLNARFEHADWGPLGAYATVPDVLQELRNGFADDTYEDTLSFYRKVPLLLMDDIGAEYHRRNGERGDWADEQLYRILDFRYGRELATIVTTNARPELVDSRIRDRLQDVGSGLCKVISENLPSYRSGQVVE